MTDAGKTKPEKTTELEKTTKPEKTTRPENKKKPDQVLLPIRPGEVYQLQMLRALTGWGDSALRAARAGGLQAIYKHGRVFYLGSDVFDYIAKAPEAEDATDSHS